MRPHQKSSNASKDPVCRCSGAGAGEESGRCRDTQGCQRHAASPGMEEKGRPVEAKKVVDSQQTYFTGTMRGAVFLQPLSGYS